MQQESKRRRVDGNLRGGAIATGAVGNADMTGHLNVDLSTLPDKTLLSVASDLGHSTSGQQPTQITNAIGQGHARMGNAITNPMVLRDMWSGNVTLGLDEIHALAERDIDNLERSHGYWVSKLRQTKEYADHASGHLLDGVPVATLRSLYESVAGTGVGTRADKQPDGDKKDDAVPPSDQSTSNGDTKQQGGGMPFSSVPFTSKVSATEPSSGRQPPPAPAGGPGDQDAFSSRFGTHSKYANELLPFLPIVGADVMGDTRQEKQQKSLNEALFSNIIREINPGDPNINPLAMGVRIDEALRFNGENRILDSVFPGGSLNIGALPATTDRVMIGRDVLEDEAHRVISIRNHRARFSSVVDHRLGKERLAIQAMPMHMTDVQWENANKSVSDFQHGAHAFNTMPVPVDMWVYRRQIDGDVPLQDNLLPAQGLFIQKQIGCGNLKPSVPLDASTRQNITFNPSMRYGWNYGVQFQ